MEVRGRRKGCCIEGSHSIAAAANGDEEAQEECPAEGGPDAKNGCAKLAATPVNEGECAVEFGTGV